MLYHRTNFIVMFLYLVVNFITYGNSSAQSIHKIDSLLIVLETAKDTHRINVLNTLCWEYRSNDPEKGLYYGMQALNLAEHLAYKKGISMCLNNIGTVFMKQGNYAKALKYYLKSLEIKEELLERAERSENPDEIGRSKNGIAASLLNIGNVYYFQGNHQLAISYYQRSLKKFEVLKDKNRIATGLANIGIIYYQQENYDKALVNFEKSLKINEALGNRLGIANCLIWIGNIYVKQEKTDKAEDYYQQCLYEYEKLGNKQGIAMSLGNIGQFYGQIGNNKKAIEYLQKTLKIAKEIGSKDLIKDAYLYIAENYSEMGEHPSTPLLNTPLTLLNRGDYFKKAYQYYQLYSQVKDTLLNEESSKQIAEMQTKYETEKKEKENQLLKKDKELQATRINRQNIIIFSIIGILFLVCVLAFLIYNRYRIKQKANILLAKKDKQITDSINYASLIQSSILPPGELIRNLLPEFFILFKPRDIVSGDFYWCSEKNGKVMLAVVDCTGHGVPGAFMSMIGNTLLNEIINEKRITKPSDILAELNTGIKKALHQNGQEAHSNDGMDLAIVSIDREKRRIIFAGARRPLYIASNGALNEIKGNSHGIGGGRKKIIKNFTQHEYRLKKGDTFYLFSDGYVDQFGGEENRKFMTERFEKLLLDINHITMKEQFSILENSFEEWKGSGKQIDDVLVIGVRV